MSGSCPGATTHFASPSQSEAPVQVPKHEPNAQMPLRPFASGQSSSFAQDCVQSPGDASIIDGAFAQTPDAHSESSAQSEYSSVPSESGEWQRPSAWHENRGGHCPSSQAKCRSASSGVHADTTTKRARRARIRTAPRC